MNIRTFTQLVRQQAASIQSAAPTLVDLSVGSVLRAFVEAVAGVAMWLQELAISVLAASRASTASGADLDAWVADFGLARLPATAAVGHVMFSRRSPGLAASIPGNTVLETPAGLRFLTGTPAELGADDLSVDVYCVAADAGPASNVEAGAVSVLVGSIPGVDNVINAAAFVGGSDGESDDALRARFRAWVAGLRQGTVAAIEYAVMSVRSGLSCAVFDGLTINGAPDPGKVVVVVDDGSGEPGAGIILAARAAAGSVRSAGVAVSVVGPMLTRVTVSVGIEVAPGAEPPIAACVAAVRDYANSLKLGEPMRITRVSSAIYAASPDVLNVGGVQISGLGSDLRLSGGHLIRLMPDGVTVNVA